MNIILAVLVFALISALFEAVLILKLKPRTRLRVLGSSVWVMVIHTVIILANLWIHFGTVTGSMTAVTAGLASFATVPVMRWYCGFIKNGKYYPGVRAYAVEQLR